MPISSGQGGNVNIFASGALSGALEVTSSLANPVWVTGNLQASLSEQSVAATGTVVPGSATIVGGWDDNGLVQSIHVDSNGFIGVYLSGSSATLAVSQTNVPATQSVFVVNSQGSNVNITASVPLTVTLTNSTASVSVSNFPATQVITASVANPVTVTGSVFVVNSQGSDVRITGSTVTVGVSQSAGWSAQVSGTVTATFTGSVPVNTGTFPVVQTTQAGALEATVSGVVGIVQSGALAAQVSGTVSSQQGGPWAVLVSGAATVSQGGIWSVQVSGTPSNPVYVATTGNLPVNTGTMPVVTVTASAANPVGVSGTVVVSSSQASPVWTTSTAPNSDLLLSPAGAQYMTSSQAEPIWATGSVSVTNAVSVYSTGNLSTLQASDSTTVPLGINLGFTGSAIDTIGYQSIAYSIISDRASAASGILLQFSPDSVNWDTRFTKEYALSKVNQVTDLVFRPHDRYFRLVYLNGAVSQSYLRVNTWLNKYDAIGDTVGVDSQVTSGMDASLVKAALVGKDNTGAFTSVQVTTAGALEVAGVETLTDNMSNPTEAIQAGAFNMVWDPGANAWQRQQSGDIDADADVPDNSGLIKAESYVKVFNGTNFDRLRGDTTGTYVILTGTVPVVPVTASQNAPVWVTSSSPNIFATGSVSGAGQTVALYVQDQSSAVIQVTGTWSGTLHFEASFDEGANWYRVEGYNPAVGQENVTSDPTVNGVWQIYDGVNGASYIRVKVDSWTSGQADIYINSAAGQAAPFFFTREDGDPTPSYGVQIAGNDAGVMRYITVDASGSVLVTSSFYKPLWVTGTITSVAAASGVFVSTEASVGGQYQPIPASATLMGAGDPTGSMLPLKVDANRNLLIAGTASVTNSISSPLNITGSITSISVDPTAGATGALAPISATLVGGVDAGGLLVPMRIEGVSADGEASLLSGVLSVEAHNKVFNGATWDRLRGSATGGLWVDIKSAVPVVVTSTQANPVWTTSTAPNSDLLLSPLGAQYMTSSLANPVIVSGAISMSNPVSSVSILNWPSIQPVSGLIGVTQSGDWKSLVSGVIGVTQSGALATLVSGTVTATFTGSVPVNTGTFPVISANVSQNSAWNTTVSGVVGVVQSGALATLVSGTVGASQSAGWSVQVSSTTGAPVYVATTGNLLVNTGTFPNITVSQSNNQNVIQFSAWNATVSGVVGIVQSGALSTQVSGTVTAAQGGAWSVQTSGTTTAAQGGAWGVLTSGVVGIVQSGALAAQVSGVVTATFTGSVPVNTGTFPIVQVTPGGAWSTQVSGTVTANQGGAWGVQISGAWSGTSVPVTSSVSFPVYVQVTGALPVASHAVTQGGAFGAAVSGIVGVTNSGAFNAFVSGIVGVTNSGAFSTFVSGVVGIVQSGALATLVSGTVGASQSAGWSVQVSSTTGAPVYVATTGNLLVNTGTMPVLVVTSSQALPVWITQSGGGGSVTVTNTASVTSTNANPVWVTGTVTTVGGAAGVQYGTGAVGPVFTGTLSLGVYNNTAVAFSATSLGLLGVTGAVSMTNANTIGGGIQYGTGSTTPYTGTLMLANQGGTVVAVSASGGALLVAITGAIDAVFSGTQIVTASSANPVWVAFTGNLPTGTFPTVNITSSVSAPAYIQVTGALPVASHAVTQGGAWNAQVSGAWSGTSIPVTSSVSFPVYVQVTGAIPVASHAVTQGGGLTTFVSGIVGVTNSGAFSTFVSGIVGVTNSGSFNAFVSGIVGVTNSGAFTTLASGAFSGADNQAGQTNTIPVTAFQEVWNGAAYDRVRASNGTQGYGLWTRGAPAGTSRVSGALINPTSATLILGANVNRMFVSIFNSSTGTSAAYVTLSTGSSILSATVRIAQNGYYEPPPFYTGTIYAITSGTGITASLAITELTV